MRKFIVLLVSVALSCCLLAGCMGDGGNDKENMVANAVSDKTECVLTGETTGFSVEVSLGEREAPYALDGVCSAKSPVFLVKATPKAECKEESLEYSMTVGGETLTGVLAKSKYRNFYSADLKKKLDCGKELTLSLKAGTETVQVTCVSVIGDGMLDYAAALKKIEEKFQDTVGASTKDGKLEGELTLRLMNDRAAEGKKYFWYAAFVKNNAEIRSMLLDASTGDVIAERNSIQAA